ncbi:TraR/DksA C4-type zinc finger protein [Evansella sp. LMS18]|uniref:TraR/DksA C4-type zinc finger protein n=1 Tax=Evansella sp. LMS18 TaxID=2924033 RepID=UPI0020D07402|nr:TraR/DksA C4-type zinc finger protein [Evansella sp. LMS18]UTR08660.1 TraR/DksA C4-type zinc finger protein [Evansella sp. LMS18]
MLTQDQINTLRDRLLELKKEHEERLAPEENETGNERRAEDTGEISRYDNHPADEATELFEREKDTALNNHSRQRLEEVEKALQAMDDGEYGKCEVCGEEIPYERLEIVPETLKCVKHAQEEGRERYRPVEEEVQKASLEDDSEAKERVAFDRKDAWETVSDYGTSQSPSDYTDSDRQYNNQQEDSENNTGITEDVEEVPVSDIEGNDTGVTSDRKEHEGGSGSRSDLDDDPKNHER